MKLIKYKSATALITVILIVAIVSITAITMQGYLRGEISHVQMLLDSDELYNEVLSIEAWGLSKISEIKTKNQGLEGINANLEYKNNNVILSGKIIEQNRLFNINNLYNLNNCQQDNILTKTATGYPIDQKSKIIGKIFTNLLVNSNNDNNLSMEEAKNITRNIQLWLCPGGETANQYKSSNSDLSKWEYQPAAQLFLDIDELKLITNINTAIYNNIKDKISAVGRLMGSNNMFEINAMSVDLLAAIAGIDVASAQKFVDENINKSDSEKLISFQSLIANQKTYSQDESQELKKILNTTSDQNKFYIIKGVASKNDYTMELETLIEVAKDIRIIWRKRGLNDNA